VIVDIKLAIKIHQATRVIGGVSYGGVNSKMLKENKKLSLALTQIIILVLGTIAMSYAIGSEVKVVSAAANSVTTDEGSGGVSEIYGPPAPPVTGGIPTALSDDEDVIASFATTELTSVGHTPDYVPPKAPLLKNLLKTLDPTQNTLFESVAVAGGLYIASKSISRALGSTKGESNALGQALALTYMAVETFGPLGLIAAPVIFLFTFLFNRDVKYEIVDFQCLPWQPAAGGDNCNKCNSQILPCSEYQCKSLGASCGLINKGTVEQKCSFSRANDIAAPIITPATEFLSDGLFYTPIESNNLNDKGVKIQNKETTSKCVEAFQPFTFGFKTDEFAQCKFSLTKKRTYEEMGASYVGNSPYSMLNHTQSVVLPSKESLETENITLRNGGQSEIYVRCQDTSKNKNVNTADFVFKYCVEETDQTAPKIMSTSVLSGSPIAYNQTSLNVEFYINEPAECKWTHDSDKSFENMEGTMVCSQRVTEFNVQNVYPCKTVLTGIKDNVENKFYVKCKDKPLATEGRNVNKVGYPFILTGTKPLVISDVGPNGTVRDSTEAVKVTLEVETTAGYKDGEAICYFSDTENEKDYNQFYPETGGNTHSQDLYLGEGTYKYYFKCVDAGGNIDRSSTEFSVESDNEAPLVVRAYHEDGALILITNEKGKCVYSTNDCTYIFEDGISIGSSEEKEYSVEWDSKRTYYIKCEDDYNNQPIPNQCSIVVRPLN
jgi:hypothetical protein